MAIINEPKHLKKKEYKEQNVRTPSKKTKKTTYKGEPQKDINFPNRIPLPFWDVAKEACLPTGVNVQNPSHLNAKTCPLRIGHIFSTLH
jgi:hypothetical protein